MDDVVMVAYSFKKRFVDPIRVGTKFQTIRAPRKRHVIPGEAIQFYCGMRTKQCSLIGESRCTRVSAIMLSFADGDFVESDAVGVLRRSAHLDQFARLDGFIDWTEMRSFWEEQHPGIDRFEGWLIQWRPLI